MPKKKKIEELIVEEPKVEEPKVEEPKVEEPKSLGFLVSGSGKNTQKHAISYKGKKIVNGIEYHDIHLERGETYLLNDRDMENQYSDK